LKCFLQLVVAVVVLVHVLLIQIIVKMVEGKKE
jgi:hypothetical protein